MDLGGGHARDSHSAGDVIVGDDGDAILASSRASRRGGNLGVVRVSRGLRRLRLLQRASAAERSLSLPRRRCSQKRGQERRQLSAAEADSSGEGEYEKEGGEKGLGAAEVVEISDSDDDADKKEAAQSGATRAVVAALSSDDGESAAADGGSPPPRRRARRAAAEGDAAGPGSASSAASSSDGVADGGIETVLRATRAARPALKRLPEALKTSKEIGRWRRFLLGLAGALGERQAEAVAADALDPQLAKSSPDEVLCSRFGARLTRRHLACLCEDEWLNDEVVNCYFRLLQERSMGPCWCPSSFFWPRLLSGGYAAVRRWAERAGIADVSALDLIVLPLNVGGIHWATGVVDLRRRCLVFLDSLGQAPPERFAPLMREFLKGEGKRRRRGGEASGSDDFLSSGPWPLLSPESVGLGKVPMQQNCSDCGVFACAYAEKAILRGSMADIDAAPSAMNGFRRRMAAAIVDGSF